MDWSVKTGVLHAFLQILFLDYITNYVVHVDLKRNTELDKDVIFNASLGRGWSYHLDRGSRSEGLNNIVSLDASKGVLYHEKTKVLCKHIRANPLHLQVLGKTHSHDNEFISNYSVISLTIFFDNLPCSVPYETSKIDHSLPSKHSVQAVIFSDVFSDWDKLNCVEKGRTVLYLNQHIPMSLQENICDVTVQNPNFQYHSRNSSVSTTRVQCLLDSDISVLLELKPCSASEHKPFSVLVSIQPSHPLFRTFQVQSRDKKPARLKRQTSNMAPSFAQAEYRASVPENQPAGISVILITATDPDQGENGKLTYSMTAIRDTRSNDMFIINPISGQVTTTKQLDREEIPRHDFRVTATDNNMLLKKSAVATLIINVEDKNDHTPTFDQEVYKVEKYENIPVATTITTVRAIDKDTGKNQEIRYSIIEPVIPTTFKIDPISGSISTLKVLDREVQANYKLVVQAKDQADFGMQRSSTATIEIKVLDENDNFPQFSQRSYTVNVSENLDITSRPVIAHVSATDADEGQNQDITYSITGGNMDDTFYIDPTTGEVSVQKPLDYEVSKEYNLKIKASDSGQVPRTNSTNLWIRIDDLNDNPPYFQSSVYTGSVVEGESIGTRVLTVRALDKDDGVNGQVEYSLINVPPAFPFAIDPDQGEISVRATLDREIQSSYSFTVQVKDKGQPQLSATVSVEITVNDINDNSPIFPQKIFYVSISEDAPINKQVIQVTANDADTGVNAHLTYSIISGNNDQVFAIERETGILTLVKTLDYKIQNKFILTVRASDSGTGNRYDTAEVHINVTDINKHTPVFRNTNYQFNVDEGAQIGTSVGRVQAIDNDVGENGRITYAIIAAEEFNIDPVTGEITTREVLNHEINTAYSFDVQASDNGDPVRQDTANVIVIVNDKNNNVPKFDKPVYEASVSEAAFDGHLVTTVHASDADSGINAQIMYRFSDVGSGYSDFEIDDASGAIRVAKNNKIDREKRNNYTLTVLAVDKGVIPLTGTAVVKIKVEDINDNAPQFAKDEITALVPENMKIGSTVAVIEAVDPDEGINADVEYSFEGGLDADKFILANQPGDPAIIVNRVDLDYESDKKEYYIRLKAASGTLFSIALVIIKVQDVNDNPPSLKDFTIIFNNYVDHFPSEPIGRVPAFDPDVSDRSKLRYKFLGNEAGFLHLNTTTGEITLDSRLNSDIPRTGDIQVVVSDGLNEVQATCRLQVRLVTLEMLEKSVTIRINNMTSDTFLSPLFGFFIDALVIIINVSKENIFVINVRNDTDVKAQILNVTVSIREKSVRVGRQVVDVFYSAEYLKEQIYLQRTLLANYSNLQILPFDDNLCLTEVCSGFEKCLSRLRFGEAAPFIASDTMLFRPIYPNNGYKCECPHGFTNNNSFSYCSVEINLCYSNPCNSSRGTCHSTEEGYTCECKPGYTGASCEVDLSVQYDTISCPADVCQPPSVCVPLINGGFRCDHCPNQVDYNQFCQQLARSFPKGSFLMYPTIKSRYRFSIQLKFATQERNGLLFYNGRFNELHDFIALEIIDAQVQFSFSTGSNIVTVSPYIPGGVNDGKWHLVRVDYLNMTATVTVGEDCDTDISVKYGRPINYNCAARASQQFTMKNCSKEGNPLNCPKLLDLTGPLQIGGLPTLPSNFQVKNKDYEGCMREFYIDGRLLDFNKSVANNGTQSGCAAKHDHCRSAPCQHGGTCLEGWETYICMCPDNWGGKDCGQMIDPPRKLNGDGYLLYDNSNGLIPNVHFGTQWFNGISFRTRHKNGTLMFIIAEDGESVHIELIDGYVTYSYSNRLGTQTFKFDAIAVSDGHWHYFEVRWPDNGDFIMILDFGQRQVLHKIHSTLEQKKIQNVYVGALKVGVAPAENHFTGCIKGMNVGNKENSVLQNPSMTNAEKGCDPGNACSSNPCTPRAECLNEWQGYSCKCPAGTLGPNCENICTNFNPCQNEATCRHPLGGTYVCECGQLQSGKYCEISSPRSCPQNWWGHPVCGPCPGNCTTENGFDPSCDKNTGKCYCRDNYYKPPGSYKCLPCNCYGHGSQSYQCDPVTGQCPCIEGVTGRRCDQCPSKYAEIRQDEETQQYGCKVDYEACPRIYSHGMWWDTKIANVMVSQSCPNNAIGTATRNCSANGLWQEPDFFNCTSKVFMDHLTQIEKIESGSLKINTFVAKTTVASLANSTSETDSMYGNDIDITVRIMNQILDYENSQSGLNLTSEQDSYFLLNVVTVLSDILQVKYGKEWSRLNQKGTGAAELLTKLENYLSTLLSALELTTTKSSRPYNVVTDNIVLSVDFINKNNYTGRNIPKFNNIVKTSMFDEDTNVFLPKSVLSEPPLQDFLRPDIQKIPKAYVGYIMFRQLGDLLPKSYSDNVRVVSGRPMSVNSPVFTLLLKDDGDNVTGSLTDPIVFTFKQLQAENRTSPQCVSWQYDSAGKGMWSSAGCVQSERYTLETAMYVKCTCSHMTSFGVLMDISNQEYVPAEPISVEVVTYIGLVVSMGCLVLCFVILFFLKRIQSNTNSIHINLVFVIFITMLTFLIGINKTESEIRCRLAAIALHYFFMTGFSWLFVDVLHVYRMITEIRNIDLGTMKFYYLIAYVIPGIIVSLSVGLYTEGYGNRNFCWLSMSDKFIWSFAGPIAFSVIINIFVFVLAMKATCQEKISVSDLAPLRIGLFANIIILLLWGVIWVTGLLSVNYKYNVLHVLYALLCLALGVFIFIMYIIVNTKVRRELKKFWYRIRGQKLDLDDNIGGTRSSLYSRSALAYRNDSCDGGLARINVGISTTSTTSRSTSKSSGGLYKGEDYLRSTSTSTSGNMPPVKYPHTGGLPPPYAYDPEKSDGLDPDSMQIHPKRETNDSDSDSEMSERVSLDLASSHSSDDDDDIDVQMDWESQMPKNKKIEEAKEQIRKQKEEFLQQHQQQPSPVIPISQHQYQNPFDQHIYSGPPSPKYSPKPLHAPGQWPGDPQLSGYNGSDSEYRTSDHPSGTLSSTQPDVTLQTPEYKGRESMIATPRRTNSIMNDSMSSTGNTQSPLGSPQVIRSPREAPHSPIQKMNSPLHSPRDRMKVKVLTHRGSVSSDSECSHETCV